MKKALRDSASTQTLPLAPTRLLSRLLGPVAPTFPSVLNCSHLLTELHPSSPCTPSSFYLIAPPQMHSDFLSNAPRFYSRDWRYKQESLTSQHWQAALLPSPHTVRGPPDTPGAHRHSQRTRSSLVLSMGAPAPVPRLCQASLIVTLTL